MLCRTICSLVIANLLYEKCEVIVYELKDNPDTRGINIAWSSYMVLKLVLPSKEGKWNEGSKDLYAFGK